MAGSMVINDVKVVNCKSGNIFEVEYRGMTIYCSVSGALRSSGASIQVGSFVDVEISSVDITHGRIINIK